MIGIADMSAVSEPFTACWWQRFNSWIERSCHEPAVLQH